MVKIFVGNLNPNSKALDLRKRFELYGKVTECDIVNNYAFVHMDSESDAEAAIAKLHNSDFDGAKINVEMSHGKRSNAGGPMRRRFNDRRPPREGFRDDRLRVPPRPYMGGPDGPRGPGGPGGMNQIRENRYGPAWGESYAGNYPPRGGPRGYDYPPSGTPGRYPERDPVRSSRGPPRETPYSGYRGSSTSEPVSRDYQRKGSPPRGRFENYESFGDYERFRDVPPHTNGTSQQRSSEYYDNYGSYSGGSYDFPGREYRANDRSSNYDSSFDYGYYDGHGNRSPVPRNSSSYSYGRP